MSTHQLKKPQPVASKIMPLYCFEVLDHSLQGKHHPEVPPEIGSDPSLLFVTWRKGKHSDLESNALRGCKGTLGNPQNLGQLLRHMALNSAFEDSRFQPISPHEFKKLHCEVSLLHSFEEAKHCYDWKVGTHGVNIDFTVFADHTKRKSVFKGGAIFLPSVAPQFGWDETETIEHLVTKAGYKHGVDLERMEIKTTRHQSSHAYVSHSEYIEWKKTRP